MTAATTKPKAQPLGPDGYRAKFGTTTKALVKSVRAYAEAHVTEGWDLVTEAMTDQEIAAAMGWSYTEKSAIAKLSKIVAVHAEREAAAQA